MLVVERINELLEQRGWGPGELAQQSGVAYDTIYQLRTGERAPVRRYRGETGVGVRLFC